MIILIEDNLSHALSIEVLLQRRATAVVHVRSPLEGYPIVREHCARQPLQLQAVLIDLNLPIKHLVAGPDGLDVATLLLDDRATGTIPPLPIVLISGDITSETAAYAQSIGVDAVVAKPLEAAFIDRLVGASLGSGQPRAARPPGRAVEQARKTFSITQQLQDTISDTQLAHPALEISEEEIWCVFATLFASFRFYKVSAEKRQLGISALAKLGGRRGFNERYGAFIRTLKQKNLPYRTRQAQILTMLYQGMEKKQIEQQLRVGRRKLENDIAEIIQDLTEFLRRG